VAEVLVVVAWVGVVVDDVDVAVLHDANSIAATVKAHKPNTRYLLFNFTSIFILSHNETVKKY
jgi:hypothetical protein